MIVTPATTDHKVTVTQNSSIVTVSSVGTVGPRGGAGTSVLSGSGAPASSLGADGDHYLDQTAFRLHVKSDGAWVDQGAYGGDQGPAGEITSVTASASAVAAGGTPTVEVTEGGSNEEKTLAFAFGVVTGDQGDAGEITSVTTSTSTVAAGGSSTSSVTEGGTNSNKTLAFAFGLPTGATGNTGNTGEITSVSATTSAVAAGGSPTVSVTEGGSNTAKTLAFAFGAVTGDKGDSGEITSVTASSTDVAAGGTSTVSVTEGGTNTDKTLAFSFGLVEGDGGTDGKTILNGTGAPGSGVGVVGDFYVDTSADTIYGPKDSSGSPWGSGVSFAVANGSVTLAKMANLATDKIIGRTTAGTGVPEALSVHDILNMAGTPSDNYILKYDSTSSQWVPEVDVDTDTTYIVEDGGLTQKNFTTDLNTKLTNIEENATADQTAEEIEDIVGGMLTGNTETGITVTYEDGDGTIDFAVASQTENDFTDTFKTKLTGIETSATADQTGAEIKTLYEAESNAYTDDLNTKLTNIEENATADQTAAEIRTLVGSATDSNVFTDALSTKLAGIAAEAEVNVNADWNSSSGDSQISNKPTLVSLSQVAALAVALG